MVVRRLCVRLMAFLVCTCLVVLIRQIFELTITWPSQPNSSICLVLCGPFSQVSHFHTLSIVWFFSELEIGLCSGNRQFFPNWRWLAQVRAKASQTEPRGSPRVKQRAKRRALAKANRLKLSVLALIFFVCFMSRLGCPWSRHFESLFNGCMQLLYQLPEMSPNHLSTDNDYKNVFGRIRFEELEWKISFLTFWVWLYGALQYLISFSKIRFGAKIRCRSAGKALKIMK